MRGLLLALAVVFAAWTLLFSICWMISVRPAVGVELGFNAPTFLRAERALLVASVTRRSPAEQMGLRPDDRIVAIDGEGLENEDSQPNAWLRHRPGDRISLTVRHGANSPPVELTARFRRVSTNGTVEHLAVTAPVIGLFDQWDCRALTGEQTDDLTLVVARGV